MNDQAAIVRVVDLETTGLPEDEDPRICEIGWADLNLDTGHVSDPVSHMVNPGVPIPTVATAIHHIRDRDVEDAISQDDAISLLTKGTSTDDVLCAHNARFERHFLPGGPRRWICTYKCALRIFPAAPSHGNQALRYFLGLDLPERFAMPPHRAGPDAFVTAHILLQMFHRGTVAQLVAASDQPARLITLGFGKHRGTGYADAPVDYLNWIVDQQDMDEDVKATAKFWLAKRGHENA
jgi:exodeoxyribonuclease X